MYPSAQAMVCNGLVNPSDAFNMVVANNSNPMDKANKKYGNITPLSKKRGPYNPLFNI